MPFKLGLMSGFQLFILGLLILVWWLPLLSLLRAWKLLAKRRFVRDGQLVVAEDSLQKIPIEYGWFLVSSEFGRLGVVASTGELQSAHRFSTPMEIVDRSGNRHELSGLVADDDQFIPKASREVIGVTEDCWEKLEAYPPQVSSSQELKKHLVLADSNYFVIVASFPSGMPVFRLENTLYLMSFARFRKSLLIRLGLAFLFAIAGTYGIMQMKAGLLAYNEKWRIFTP